jgi:hypothetical protein
MTGKSWKNRASSKTELSFRRIALFSPVSRFRFKSSKLAKKVKQRLVGQHRAEKNATNKLFEANRMLAAYPADINAPTASEDTRNLLKKPPEIKLLYRNRNRRS